MKQLVSTAWLEGELGSDDLVVLDCTVFLTMGDKRTASLQEWVADPEAPMTTAT